MYLLVRNKKTKVKNRINTSTRDFNSQTQLQCLKAEDLEQNKLNGVSINAFSPSIQKKTNKNQRRVEGRSFEIPAQSGAAQSRQSSETSSGSRINRQCKAMYTLMLNLRIRY